MEIMLTGDRPTGALHLGHYVGSLKQRCIMQKAYKSYIMIANTQGLTDYFKTPEKIRHNILQVLEDYLACGIDPSKVTIFVQSEIKALFEITTYFMNLVTLARVKRNPTVKAELMQKDYKEDVPCGFLCYPISQAADITAFLTDIVPVGKDQEPMIEQANDIVDAFNSTYNCNILKRCKAYLGEVPKLMGIDGKNKASKSLGNAILLNDNDEELRRKVFSMYTDPSHVRVTDPGHVEGNMVFHYLDVFYENKENLMQLKKDYQKGGLGDVELKKLLFSTLQSFLIPIRENRSKINKNHLIDILIKGNEDASNMAQSTLNKMKDVMFLNF